MDIKDIKYCIIIDGFYKKRTNLVYGGKLYEKVGHYMEKIPDDFLAFCSGVGMRVTL